MPVKGIPVKTLIFVSAACLAFSCGRVISDEDAGVSAGGGTSSTGSVGGSASAGGSSAGGSASTVDAGSLPKFSFFVTSLNALQDLSGSQSGFGGDLRFGETGPGAGLRGADKLCATIAERSMPGASAKPWRAFLSAIDDGAGQPVHAIDRVGNGPWYDRLGRIVAASRADLLHDRPEGADPAIQNDLPNEVRRYLLLRALALIQAARLSRRARIASPTDPPTRAPTRTPPTPWRRSPAGVAAS